MKQISHHRGFTLIETIVAISVLMLGIIGPMTLAARNIKASRDASDRLIASFLAQEGIEVVRSNIANNSADDNPWLDGITGVPGQCDQPSRCIADITQANSGLPQPGRNILQACNGLCTEEVYQHGATYVFRQSSTGAPGAPWVPTKFQRHISVEVYPGDTKRVLVSTTVWWPRGTITLEEDVYNWFFQIN